MAEMDIGRRDKRGEWQPGSLPAPSPLFSWPPKLGKIAKHILGYNGVLWPINLFVALISIAIWQWFTPSLEQTATFRIGWIALIYVRNVVLLIVICGGLHLRQYMLRAQGLKYRYTDKWLAKNDGKFLFRNQTYDNIFWNVTSGAIIWTAYEAFSLWLYGNNVIPMITFSSRPIYFVLLMVGVIYLRLIHFYFVHRLIHWPPLYKSSHYLHHKNVNIGPWSGITMHPIEHVLYFSGAILHWIIPSHPVHMIFHLIHAGTTAGIGHVGFHRLVGKGDSGLQTDFYFHYLHHRYFTVNFGDESVPLDKWFGTHLDGSQEELKAMMERRKREKMATEESVG